jgi:glycosyltransferase involved in cell wall biosynthesis
MTVDPFSVQRVADAGEATIPLFSVIIPTFDRPEMVREAVDSVLAQTVQDFECLVVDDGGALPVNVPDDPRIRVIQRNSSGGPAAARNEGIEAARGRYVTFLDDDDRFFPDRLADVLSALEDNPVVICWRTGGDRTLNGDVADVILDDLVPHVGQVSLRRDITPRFREEFMASEDVEWWLRLALALPVKTVPRVGYLYRLHEGPRNRIGLEARTAGLRRLLDEEPEYFKTRPRARGFQWKQIGLAEMRRDARRAAAGAFLQSLLAAPSIRTGWHLLRALAAIARPRGRTDRDSY